MTSLSTSALTRNKTILIVEDDGTIVLHLQTLLQNWGYHTVAAASGEAALRQAAEARPDLALVDVQLAGPMDGITAAGQLRARFDVPAIYLTAYADEALLKRARETQPYGYLVKPLQELELRASLEMALSRRELDRQLQESEARFRRLAENAPDIIYRYRLAPSPGFEYISPAVTDITGYTPEEHYADPELGFKLVLPDDEPTLRSALASPEVRNEPLIMRWTHKSGAVIWTEHRWVPVYDPEGNCIALEGIARDVTQRQQAEAKQKATLEALQKSQALLDATQRMARVGGWEFDVETLEQVWTAETYRIHEVEPDYEPTVEKGIAFFAPESIPVIQEAVQKAISMGEPYDLELPFVTARGNRRWVRTMGRAIQENGKTIKVGGTIQDITRRKRMELERDATLKALERSNQERQTLLEIMPVGITITDENGQIIDANRTSEQLLGISVTEHAERRYDGPQWDIVRPDGTPMPAQEYTSVRALQEQRTIRNEEMGIIRPDGEVTWISVTATPIPLEGYGVAIAYADVTQRKQAEEALRESEARYRTLVEHAPISIVVHTEDEILYLNPEAVKKLGGSSPADFIGQSPLSLLPPEDRSIGRQRIQTFYETREPVPLMDQRLLRLDNETIYAEMTAANINFEGQPAAQVVFRDVTARKRMEAALEAQAWELARSNADLEQFAYLASHDLQEPLRMITGFLKLLERRYRDQLDDPAQEYVDLAMDGARRMQDMIRALLDLSRVTTRGRELAPTDCEALLEQVLSDLQVSIRESDATITYDPLPTVLGDKVQLGQVFQNLLGNAIKFAGEEGPRIHVSAHKESTPEGSYWRLSVSDKGIGIDPAHSERIFEIFQRAHGDAYAGLGMGLALCQKIVRRHGGRIWVESQPGDGATFYFTVPAVPPNATSIGEQKK